MNATSETLPGDQLRRIAILQNAAEALKYIVKQTLAEDSDVSAKARYALSAVCQACGGEVLPHQKQLILRTMVARRDTTWVEIGELSEEAQEQLIQDNLWILAVDYGQ